MTQYECKKCNYITARKSDYNKHIKTNKHNRAQLAGNNKKSGQNYKWECGCKKKYKYDSGFYRHKKICTHANNAIQLNKQHTEDKIVNTNLHETVLSLVEENKELKKMIVKQMNTIEKIVPKVGNVTNNTLNLQVFLYEDCKDALNLNDFINGLNIGVTDLEHTRKYGLCEGVQNIFMNGLKELGTHKRPIHCTDVKREILYIKDNNSWEKKGEESKDKLRKSLETIAYKQRKLIKEWENNNPSWNKTEKGKEEWIKLVQAITSSFDNHSEEAKVIKNIVKEVKIN